MTETGGRGSADSHIQTYRPEIDGLRAIAVLSVVIFHLSSAALPGGYLGVDVFFVISGYLITQVILKETAAGTFSLRRFYERRVRRIAPALIAVLAVTTAVSAALMLPVDLVEYAWSLLAALAFVSNIYFWRDSGYFSHGAEMKPLLHTWTLGVEEQFYVLVPLVLLLLVRRWPKAALAAIVGATALSFLANVVAIRVGGENPAFFLLPTRAWELGAGAILAALGSRGSSRPAAALGVVLIVFGLAGGMMHHPIPHALPVVIGTALIIWSGKTPVASVLSVRPAVAIGLISYSLYLWHWPIIALARYYFVSDLGVWLSVAVFIAMLGIAALSWRFIERPFRDRSMPARTVWTDAIVGTVTLASVAGGIIAANGFPGRLSERAASINAAVGTHYRCAVSDYLAFGAGRACVMNLPSRDPTDADVILLGNSHAQAYAPLVESIIEPTGMTGLLVPANGCLPTLGVNISAECHAVAEANIKAVAALSRPRIVILATTWRAPGGLFERDGRELQPKALLAGIDATIERLKASGKNVVVVGPIATPGKDVASDTSRRLAYARPLEMPLSISRQEFDRTFGDVLAHFRDRRDVSFIRPDLAQCDAERCYFIKDAQSLFSDSTHLAQAALPRFRQQFERGLEVVVAPFQGPSGLYEPHQRQSAPGDQQQN